MKTFFIKIVLLFFSITLFSCIEDLVDENVGGVFTPTVTGSILYLEATEALINSSATTPVLVETANFDGFKSEAFAGRVLSGSITYEITNSTSKNLTLIIDLLDDNNAVLDTESITIPANTTSVITREVFYGPPTGRDINNIKNLSAIRTILTNNSDSTSVSSASDPKLIFKSKGEFKLQLVQ